MHLNTLPSVLSKVEGKRGYIPKVPSEKVASRCATVYSVHMYSLSIHRPLVAMVLQTSNHTFPHQLQQLLMRVTYMHNLQAVYSGMQFLGKSGEVALE